MFTRLLGDDSPAALFAGAAGVALLALAGVVIAGRGTLAATDTLEGSLLLLAMPLLSPQGWDYVLLIAAPADHAADRQPPGATPGPAARGAGRRRRHRAFHLRPRGAAGVCDADGSVGDYRLRPGRVCGAGGAALPPRGVVAYHLGMRLVAVLCGLVLGSAMQLPAMKPDPDLGVSQALAGDRSARIADVRYDIALTIPESRQQPVTGRELLRFNLRDVSAPLVVDFAPDRSGMLKATEVNGAAAAIRQVNGHIIVPPDVLHPGANVLSFEFNAGDASLNRSDDFLYTIFVPARAHVAFPCFDQPDLKARWTLALDVPDGWEVLGNGAERDAQCRRRPDARALRAKRSRSRPTSSPSPRASSRSRQAERNGRTFRMFHRETDAAKVARNRDAIFDLHAAALAGSNSTPASPIRSASSISCWCPPSSSAAWNIPARSSTTPAACCSTRARPRIRCSNRASTISHETAHMWFGDLVTMRWFDDVWMKEVFANFMAAKIVNPSFPGDQPRAAVPAGLLSGGLRRRPHRRHQRNPPAAREPQRGRHALRRDHLSEGADRHAPARNAGRRRSVPGRPARLSQGATPSATRRGPT